MTLTSHLAQMLNICAGDFHQNRTNTFREITMSVTNERKKTNQPTNKLFSQNVVAGVIIVQCRTVSQLLSLRRKHISKLLINTKPASSQRTHSFLTIVCHCQLYWRQSYTLANYTTLYTAYGHSLSIWVVLTYRCFVYASVSTLEHL